jgi:hypothetical protein
MTDGPGPAPPDHADRSAPPAAAGQGQAHGPGADGPPGAADDGPGRGALVLCHGDLHVRHLLIDGDGSAAGVIDWGDLCLADAAVDLSIAYFAFAGKRARTCCPLWPARPR